MRGRKIAVPSLDHLLALSDDTGIIQHAVYDVPNRSTGYCTDDVARAFMVAVSLHDIGTRKDAAARLASTYLAFLQDAQLADGWFHNFMSYGRSWLDERGTQDSFGRAVWALGFGMRYAKRESWRKVCERLLQSAAARLPDLRYLRSTAYATIGLSHALESRPAEAKLIREWLAPLAATLRDAYVAHQAPDWQWFEDGMTYDNARLCEAMLRAGTALRDDELIAIGLRTLAFYERIVIENGMFVPIGNDGWFPRGGIRARYGQQPLEAAASIEAALTAHDCTSAPAFVALAHAAFDWFHGKNTADAEMAERGGCRDGIDPQGANANMGAESTLAYLSSAAMLAERPANRLRVAR
ncbi:MAG: glycosyltransferase [Candidatus Meridianibacter frigidus]|nr:MAG: glycosyltransferase [Candidatus Eremiobacteraeota bacterium]